MQMLFDFIHNREEADAWEIFKRIRLSKDPLAVLQAVKDADLVLPNPSLVAAASDLSDPRIRKLDDAARAESPIHVPARPWTAVAGDGLVSELICGLFSWDIYLYSFFHPSALMAEMRSADPNTAQYCSPFLVNAICAFRAVSPATCSQPILSHAVAQLPSSCFRLTQSIGSWFLPMRAL